MWKVLRCETLFNFPTFQMTTDLLFDFIKGFLFLAIPLIAVYQICKTRNRNPVKGVVVVGLLTLIPFMNWIAMFLLWLGLRKRDGEGRLM